MKLCGRENWCRVGWLIVVLNLLILPVSIKAQTINLPPVLNMGIPNQHAEMGEAFSYTIPVNAFRDQNNDPLTYSITGAMPPGLSYDPSSRIISGTPTISGTTTVSVQVSDGNIQRSTSFTIKVHPSGGTYAAFTMNTKFGCGFREVRFINKSKGDDTYEWNFGNGDPIVTNVRDPQVIYNGPGNYTVRLTINKDEANESIHTETITIYPRPLPEIDDLNHGCEPLDATLVSIGNPVSINGVTGGTEQYYTWNLTGLAAHHSLNQTTSIPNLQGGQYRVNLSVTDANGCNSNNPNIVTLNVFENPTANFEYTKADNCNPSPTTFTDLSVVGDSEIEAYEWTVKRGLNTIYTGNDNSPFAFDFTPHGPGNYVVTLRTRSENGCWSEPYTETITFNTNNTSDFSVENFYCLGETIELSANTSAGVFSLNWEINGTNVSTAQSHDFMPGNAGNYQIKLSVLFNDGCIIETTKDVEVDDLPNDFNYNSQYNCAPANNFTVNFSAPENTLQEYPITTYEWYRVIGITETLIGTGKEFQYIFSSTSPQIKLYMESSNGCSKTITKELDLQNPSVGIIISGDNTGCFDGGKTINFQADFSTQYAPAVAYQWNFGDGQTGSGQNVSHNYTSAGSYNVSVTVTDDNGCIFNTTLNGAVQLADQPTISAVVVNQSANKCFNDIIELEIYYSAGTDYLSITSPEGEVVIENPGTSPYTYEYIPVDVGIINFEVIAGQYGCLSAPYSVNNIEINGPKAQFSTSPSTVCNEPLIVNFNNTSTYSDPDTEFIWNFGDGETSTIISPSHTFSTSGNYTVELTAINPNTGCSHTYTDTINVYSFNDESGIIGADITAGCAPLEVNFTQDILSRLSPNYPVEAIRWDFENNGTIDTTTSVSASLNFTYTTPGAYSVRIIIVSPGNCDYEYIEENLISASGPIVDFDYNPKPACFGEEINFNGNVSKPGFDTADPSLNTYSWDFGDGITTSNTLTPTHIYTKDSTYTVSLEVTDENGCTTLQEKPGLIEIIEFEPRFEIAGQGAIFCNNTNIEFQNTSSGDIARYYWDLNGDGTFDLETTSGQNVNYEYPSAGTYNIRLMAEATNGCTKIHEQSIEIINATASFSASKTNIGCAPANAYFSPSANYEDVVSYYWDFGDGSTSNLREPVNRYQIPGSYTVSLTIEFVGGCSRTTTRNNYIKVDGAYGVLEYDTIPGCAPYEVNLRIREISRVNVINWYFGTGIVQRDTLPEPEPDTFEISYTYETMGGRMPTVILTDSVCGDYEYENLDLGSIYTSGPPVSEFTADFDTICQGAPLQFTDNSYSPDPNYALSAWKWHFGNSSNDSALVRNPEFAYPDQGDFSPQLIAYNELGCSDTIRKGNSIHIVQNDVSSYFDFPNHDGIVCPWDEITFTSLADPGTRSRITKYEWDFGNGYIESGTTANYTYNNIFKGESLEVIHKVTDNYLCIDSTQRTVEISNLQAGLGYEPQPVFRGRPVDFSDQSLTDAGTSVNSWKWNFGNGSPAQSSSRNPGNITYNNIIENNPVSLIVTNSIGCTDTTTQFFDVLNNPPSLEDFSILLVEGRTYTFNIDEFETRFDPEDPGQSMDFIRIQSNPANGAFYFNGQPYSLNTQIPFSEIHLLTFVPDEGWNGDTWCFWNAYDGYDWAVNPGTINIEVIENPSPPTLNDIVFNLNKDEIATITRADFMAHIESDLGASFDFDSLWIYIAPTPPGAGMLRFNNAPISGYPLLLTSDEINNSNLVFTYHPAQNFDGQITFEWNAYDGYNFAEESARVIINYINRPPVAESDTFTVYENFGTIYHTMEGYWNVLNNDYDPDIYDSFTMHRVNGSMAKTTQGINGYGTFNWHSQGTWNYREKYQNTQGLAGGQIADEVFSYTIFDQTDESAEGLIVFRIIGQNDPPTAINDTIRISEKDISTPFNALTNDFDIDEGDETTMTLIEGNTLSPVQVNDFSRLFWDADGECTFEIIQNIDTLSAGQSIKVEYTYTISDDSSATDEALIVIIISGANDPPVAVNDTLHVLENDLTISPEWSLLDNDFDSDSDNIWLTLLNNNSHSPVNTPYAAFDWTEEGFFTYNRYIHEDIRNGLDTLSHNDVISDLIPYTISDTEGASGNAWLVLVIQGENDPPVAVSDRVTIMQNMESITSSESILANDYDVDRGDSIALVNINNNLSGELQGEYGLLVWDEFGNYTYYIDHDATASIPRDAREYDKFPYTISDLSGETDTDTLIIEIVGVNYPPTAADVFIGINEKDSITDIHPTDNGLLINSFDIDGDPVSLVIPGNDPPGSYNGKYGWLSYLADGTATYTLYNTLDSLTVGQQARDTIPFTITDTNNATSTANLIVIITGSNDPPAAQDIFFSIPEDSLTVIAEPGSSIAMLTNVFDIDGDALRVAEVNSSTERISVDTNEYGTLYWNPNGTYTFENNREKTATIPLDESVHVTYTFVIADPHPMGRDTATLTIEITGLNNPPFAGPMYYSTYDVNPIIVEPESDRNMMANSSDVDGQVAQVTHVNESTNKISISEQGFGVLTWNNDGSFIYEPDPLIAKAIAPDDSIRDHFRFTVIDNHAEPASSSIYIDIKGINYAPEADSVILRFEHELIYTPLDTAIIPYSVFDYENDPVSLVNIDNDASGTASGVYANITWDENGTITITPIQETVQNIKPNEFVSEEFTYVVSDIHGEQGEALIIIEFIGVNDSIQAIDDNATILQNTYLLHNVVANDINPDDNFDYGSLKIDIQPQNGRAFVNSATGDIYYIPGENFNGSDSLQYTICDEGMPVYCDNAWLYIEVIPVNILPEASNLLLRTNINTPVSFNYFNQVADIDDGIDPGSIQIVQNASEGLIEYRDSTITYSPDSLFMGIDEFIYSLSDFQGENAYVIVNVIVQDEGFGAQDDYVETMQRTPVNANVLENDTLNGFVPNPLSLDIKVFPKNGTAHYDPDTRTVTYQPQDNFNGTDSLYYSVNSYTGSIDFAKLVITVNPVNKPIIANNDAATTLSGQDVTIRILDNDYDLDDGIDSTSVILTVEPENGEAIYNATSGRVTYIPEPGFTGSDIFNYRVCDLNTSDPSCDEAIVNILVRDPLSTLKASNDSYTMFENDTLDLIYPNHPLDNDSVENITSTEFSIVNGPLNGSYLFDDNTRIITYIPDENFNGLDWITYQICEGGECDIAEINIWVEPVNTPPVATNDSYVVNDNRAKRLYILVNDYDIDGHLVWTSLDTVASEGPRFGTVEFDRLTGTILYTPTVNKGIDEFKYQICDNDGACAEATVTIVIELGTIIFHQIETLEDTPVGFDIAPLLEKFNLNFDVVGAEGILEAEIGTWELTNNNSRILYTPGQDLNGNDYFELFLFSADNDVMAELRVAVWVEPVNDPPVAMPDTVIWEMESNTTISSFHHILKNDYDADGDSITLTADAIEWSDHFDISFNETDSTIIITTNEMDWCDAWFSYEISDPDGETDIGSVLIIPNLDIYNLIAADDYFEVPMNNNLSTPANMGNVLDVLNNDSLLDNQRCIIDSMLIITPPLYAESEVDPENNIVYSPDLYFFGLDSLQYRIVDIWGQADTAWVVIDVQFRNIPPVAEDDKIILALGESNEIFILENDYDPDYPYDSIVISQTYLVIDDLPKFGTSVFDPQTGIVTYTPEELSCEADWFTYMIFDTHGDSTMATVFVNIPDEPPLYPVNDTIRTWPTVPVEFNVLDNDQGYFIPWIDEFTQPFSGSVQQTGDSTFIFYPNPDFMENDSMSYQLVSPCGNEKTGWVIFMIEELKVPEIITPNDDGKNDVLIIDGIEYFPNSWLKIFNRYGHVVYQKRGYDNSWGGYSNQGSFGGNRPLPGGTYYYTLIYNEERNKQAGIIYIFK
jgi:gliding motility-associated-like protein